jgi:hypothetical protein
MIGSRSISCYMTEVSGKCVICAKPVEKKLPCGTARRVKHLLCGGYRCKIALAAKLGRERKAARK